MKRIIKDYFTFGKKERVAVIILLLLMAAFIVAPYFYAVKPRPPLVNKALQNFLAHNKNADEPRDSLERNTVFVNTSAPENSVPRKLFYFDPNIVSGEGWKQLGVSDKTIKTILNYRNKGGKFRAAEDIRKIWGFKKADADALLPFVQITETVTTFNPKINPTQNFKPQTSNKKQPIQIDINAATAEEWQSLPGIGEVLANRIIRFREKIGGFTSTEQVHKTYGISDSVFTVISPYLKNNVTTNIPKLNVNKASAYDLKMKVGITDAIARSIVVYRQQYGPFKSIDELKKIVFITDSLFARITPNLFIE